MKRFIKYVTILTLVFVVFACKKVNIEPNDAFVNESQNDYLIKTKKTGCKENVLSTDETDKEEGITDPNNDDFSNKGNIKKRFTIKFH